MNPHGTPSMRNNPSGTLEIYAGRTAVAAGAGGFPWEKPPWEALGGVFLGGNLLGRPWEELPWEGVFLGKNLLGGTLQELAALRPPARILL